jgi:hypothetical protein
VSLQDLKALFDNGAIYEDTLVWSVARGGDWAKYSDTFRDNGAASAPPIPSSQITDLWVWCIAAVPILGAVIEAWVAASSKLPLNPLVIIAAYAATNGALAMLDTSAIRKSGRNDRSISALAFVLVPAYLFVRAKRLGRSQITLATWVLAIAASIYLPSDTILSYTNFSFSLPSCSSGTSVAQIKAIFPDIPVNLGKLPALEVQDIKTSSNTETLNSCTATVLTAGQTRIPISYTIEERNGQYYYYVQIEF